MPAKAAPAASAGSAYESLLGKRPDAGADADQEGERRTKLRRYDKMAAQCLNPEGVSPIHAADLKGVWEMAAAGNKGAAYFTELADMDDYRRGVGLSRAAETLLAMGAALDQPVFKQVCQKDILAKALREFQTLKPHLEVLNGGKASQTTKTSTSLWAQAAKAQAQQAPVLEVGAVQAAAGVLYDHFDVKNSALRAFVEIMSQGGVFYSAFVADKVLRAWLAHGGIAKQDFCRAAEKRLCTKPKESSTGAGDELTEAYAALGVKKSS